MQETILALRQIINMCLLATWIQQVIDKRQVLVNERIVVR